ncbi:MAG TPA: hypothetical protein VFD58_20115 [Blastocatellia bacterium]|nr:hypothetical protein [Blastocatellia bacterium]
MTIARNGNIGIGTTNPTEKLVAQTPTSSYGLIHTDGTAVVGTWVGAGGTGANGGWFGTKSNHPLRFFTNNGGAIMTIGTDGNISIGSTVTGLAKLFVDGSPGIAVFGSSPGIGVYGGTTNGAGISGVSTGIGTGVSGNSASGYGVYGVSNSLDHASVYGINTNANVGHGVIGISNGSNGAGVLGYGYGSEGIGVYGEGIGLAAWFKGDVFVSGTFVNYASRLRTDHPLDPENKYLNHAFLDSPEAKTVYDGTVTTDQNGEANVNLLDYAEALSHDFRYQRTVIGAFAQAIVAGEVKDNRFTIRTSAPGVKVSWQVTGVRSDAATLKHSFKVEEDKPERERGTYLNPGAFGQPEEKGLMRARYPGMAQGLKERREREQKEQARPPNP